MNFRLKRQSRLLATLPGLLWLAMARAQPETQQNLADLTIEELSNIQITSVSKKPERLSDAAASVFVITADDIRRSGAASLADALRLAPNLQVGQVSAAGYAISARGMNGSSNSAPNKLLVLIDGRSVYSPLFSGVFWDVQDVVLEDIDRIEVISGPGATLWGVNAVNGVINVITRSAADVSGQLIVASAGTRGSSGAFRSAGTLAGGGHFTVFGKYFERDNSELADGAAVRDGWHRSALGFRSDAAAAEGNLTVTGNIYQVLEGQPLPGAIAVSGTSAQLGAITASGANLSAHWARALADGGNVSVLAYYDQTRRTVPPTFAESLGIANIELQHSLPAHGIHSFVWGANLRYARDDISNSAIIAFLPAQTGQKWTSLFFQDEMALSAALRLSAGARLERNDYTGKESLPSVRLAWKPAFASLLWGALSRTVRAPTRLDRDAFVPGRPPFLLNGGSDVVSEVARVAELGYRGQPTERLSFAVTVFHNQYDHLRTQEIAPSRTFIVFDSKMQGQATGLESWGSFQATSAWRISAGYSLLHERLTPLAGSNDVQSPTTAGKDPAHSLMLRSSLALGERCNVDVGLRKVAKLSSPDVPAYTALDARVGWNIRPNLELSLAGQNLNGAHAEYGPLATRSDMPRALAIRLSYRN